MYVSIDGILEAGVPVSATTVNSDISRVQWKSCVYYIVKARFAVVTIRFSHLEAHANDKFLKIWQNRK